MVYFEDSYERVQTDTKNYVIAIVRVLAMLMIIGCHLSSWFDINFLAMILNVGVYVFLLISGILYSNKTINSSFDFIKKRWVKLCIPVYFLFIFLLIYNLCVSNLEVLKSIPIYLFNLQGLGFIVSVESLPLMNGLEHLWFLTAIMICYIAMIFVKKYERNNFWTSNRHVIIFFAVLIASDILLAYLQISLQYLLIFFIGYAVGKRKSRCSVKMYILLTLAMILAMGIRLLGHKYIDGTTAYVFLIVCFTHMVLATWIYMTVQFFSDKLPKVSEKIGKSKIMNWFEKMSLYLYMTHYMFLVGPFYVSDLPVPKPLQLIVFVIGTVLSAVLLKILSEKTTYRLSSLQEMKS